MSSEYDEGFGPASARVDAEVVEAGIVSGMRPLARSARSTAPAAPGGRVLSAWGLVMVLSWLLVLTAAAVDTIRANFGVALLISGIEAALIVLFFMRFLWDRRMHVLIVGLGALFITLLFVAVYSDRSEYQPALDDWGKAVGGKWMSAGTAD